MATMLQSPALSAPTGIRHGFFTRTGGVSTGCYESLNAGVGSNDAPALVAENRARMAAAVGVLPERLISAYQIHSPVVVTVDAPWDVNARPKADAIVTRASGLAIAVSTADCGPILFADAAAGVIGAAHAGWRGALSGVVEATLAAMECSRADPSRLLAPIGPMTRQPNYEVGPEFVEQFAANDVGNVRFFQSAPRPGHSLFDLAGYVAARLLQAGIGRIDDLDRCTYAEPQTFFSYRRSVHRR